MLDILCCLKKHTPLLMAANKKMLAQFMLGDKVMSLALFVLGIDVDSHTLPRSLSLSLSLSLKPHLQYL